MFVSQAPEEPRPAGSRLGPRPSEGVLHVCLERVGQLELWLQKAQRSLVAAGATTMQDSVEQQLLTCQVSSSLQGSRVLPGFTSQKRSRYHSVRTALNEAET